MNSAKNQCVSTTIKIPVSSLKSGKAIMDGKTMDAFEAKKYPNIENISYKAVKPAVHDLLGNHINAVVIGSVTDIVEPLAGLANSTDRKINGIPTFLECLGINNPITMDFLIMANASSDDRFIKSTESLVLEFLKDKEIQEYYRTNIMYVDARLKTVNSQLNRWKEMQK